MLYSLRGKLIAVSSAQAVVECGGVGYQCNTTLSTLGSLPAIGNEVTLYTYLSVRENGIDLFGFSTLSEVSCFKMLTSVSGVGARVGIAILSEIRPEQVFLNIVSGDVKGLTKAPGVGPKLAQRIILELKDKVKNQDLTQSYSQVAEAMGAAANGGNVGEAMSALVVLGYSQSEAAQSVSGLPNDMPVEEMIKAALKKLSGRK